MLTQLPLGKATTVELVVPVVCSDCMSINAVMMMTALGMMVVAVLLGYLHGRAVGTEIKQKPAEIKQNRVVVQKSMRSVGTMSQMTYRRDYAAPRFAAVPETGQGVTL